MFCQLLLLVLQVSFSVWSPFCCASIFLFFSSLKIFFKTLFCFTFVHTFSPIQSQCWRFCFVHYFFDIFPRVSLDFSKLFTATFVNIVVANNFFRMQSVNQTNPGLNLFAKNPTHDCRRLSVVQVIHFIAFIHVPPCNLNRWQTFGSLQFQMQFVRRCTIAIGCAAKFFRTFFQ